MKFFALIFATVFYASVAQASWVLPVDTLECTPTVNPWGQSESCFCPEGTRYNEKIGQCLSGEPYPIMVSGYIRSKDALEKGVSLDTAFGPFKLIVKTSEITKLQRVNGYSFEVEGEFVLLQKEPVIIVDALRWLE